MNAATLRYIRKALNLSQTELAELVGLSFVTIFRYEHGKQEPQPKTLRQMQKALGYTESDLVEISELLEENESSNRRHAALKTKLQQQALQRQTTI